jgi:predicted TIM-barrel fold metal-dependent hydrolase
MPEVIDCAVHPAVPDRDTLRHYMAAPWRSRPFPGPERYFYPAPIPEFLGEAGVPAGSDPALAARRLFEEGGAAYAILLPLTRGLLPDLDLAAAVCAATNDWLADVWLDRHNRHGRFRGSIRVDPREPELAVREIERWADHPYMVQVAVPLQAHQPYGQRRYLPVWEAAARHHLPVAVHADGGSGVDFWPTPVGYSQHFIEYAAYQPLNFAFHLASLIAEGVFDRLPDLRFVFADGGLEFLPPLLWRMDKNWRSTRPETPWVRQLPSAYLRQHVRFCAHRLDWPADPGQAGRWLEISDAGHLLLFASNWPYWDTWDAATAFAAAPPAMRARILAETARGLYGLT